MIKKIAVSLLSLSFLIGSSPLSCFGLDNVADSNNYEIIDAVTQIKLQKVYARTDIIQMYLVATAAMKDKILEKETDISSINIALYYAMFLEFSLPLANSPKEKWYPQRGERTISSPWLELTETVSVDGAREIEIRIDATGPKFVMDLFSDPYPRLIMDSFFNPNDRAITTNFLQVDPMSETCFVEATGSYKDVSIGGSTVIFPSGFSCVSEPLRRPLLSLFLSSKQEFFLPFRPYVFDKLYECQDIAQDYYSELYTGLAIRALEILNSESEPEAMWWAGVLSQTDRHRRKCQ